ncbi:MAG: hypothetical protein EHM47_01410 [Ignavibacteriales bacterium]|nr:MAG: hypothetical protein EHM47_01410 [Ignavibacteriales bacterium]
MSVLIDILGSTVIAGLLLFLVIKQNLFITNASYFSDNELRLQQNAKTLAEIINYDMRKLGYMNNSVSVLIAEKEKIKFIGDLEKPGVTGHGIVDTVEYFLTDPSYAIATVNPRDRVLVRVLNNSDSLGGPSLGLVKLQFTYLDSLSTITNNLSKIRFIKTEMWLEPVEPVINNAASKIDSLFTYWEFTIHPRNI